MQAETFNQAQLLTLNELVQALPMAQRKSYLQDLGELWEYLKVSEDYLIDERDYNIYSIVRIGNQEWLGENLRYKGVRHYEHPEHPNLFYGCLYDWAAMMDIDGKYNKEYWEQSDVCHQGIAPNGWHIPSDKDWKELECILGMSELEVDKEDHRGDIGDELKSTYGWYDNHNGNDSNEFTVLPAGAYWEGRFYLGKEANFWTSTEQLGGIASFNYAWGRFFYCDDNAINRDSDIRVNAYSCRCLKNKVGFR